MVNRLSEKGLLVTLESIKGVESMGEDVEELIDKSKQNVSLFVVGKDNERRSRTKKLAHFKIRSQFDVKFSLRRSKDV